MLEQQQNQASPCKYVLQFAIFLMEKIMITKIIKHLFRSFSSYSCVLVHGLFYENNIPNPPCIKIACSLRGVCVCFENGVQLLIKRNFFGVVCIKIYELNCLIFASIIYHITVCSCAAVKTCVSCFTCHISRRQVTRP